MGKQSFVSKGTGQDNTNQRTDSGDVILKGSKQDDIQKIVNRKTAVAFKSKGAPQDASTANEYANTVEFGPSSKGSHTTIYKDPSAHVPQYKKGGMVKATGIAKIHKGERVLTKSQAKGFKKR